MPHRPLTRLEYEQRTRRLTQCELGRRAGLTQPLVSAIMRGRVVPTEDELARLASVLKITPPSEETAAVFLSILRAE